MSTCYTTPKVLDEVSHHEVEEAKIQSLIDIGRLNVIEPTLDSINVVTDSSTRSGDISQLSQTDISVLALALQLKNQGLDIFTVSDDFAVENSARLLDIPITPIITRGIKKVVKWITYCRGCGKVFKNKRIVSCDVCGTELKRKFG